LRERSPSQPPQARPTAKFLQWIAVRVSTTLIADELAVSGRAAQNLIRELGLREITGRGRYRAWAI
jgi:hypothetical protein